MKVINYQVIFDVDIQYLLHFSRLLVLRHGNSFTESVSYMIRTGDDRIVFPTKISAFIGNSLILRHIINVQHYHDILQQSGITSYNKSLSPILKEYYCYGEFLRNVMEITNLTKEIMIIRYPLVYTENFDAIQLRMGGNLADYPLHESWLTKGSLDVAVRCISTHFKSFNIYVASDSMFAKKYMKQHLRNKNVSFVNEKSPFSDTQIMSLKSVSLATYTAVADLYILGRSKTCIMTQSSTFAYAGCAISKSPPLIVTKKAKTCLGSNYLLVK